MDKLRWKICVVTKLAHVSFGQVVPHHKEHYYGDLANAILYGDGVVWLPTDLPLLLEAGHEKSIAPAAMKDSAKRIIEDFERNLPKLVSIIRFSEDFSFYIPSSLRASASEEVFEAFANNKWFQPSGVSNEEIWRNLQKRIFQLLSFNKFEIAFGASKEIVEYIRSTQACMVDPESPYATKLPSHWDAHRAAQNLMKAISKILLPDVSKIPLSEIVVLRNQLKDELDPMRAELLRLTEDLRKMVKEELSEDEVTRQAENLIKTRVEPVVREAHSHAKEVLKKKRRSVTEKVLKFFGFVGLGFLIPTLAKDALKQGLDIVAEAVTLTEKAKPPTATAHFVLQARGRLSKSYE